jgi:acetyl-CoA acetyltransferase/uncharacterized OB-fold protein
MVAGAESGELPGVDAGNASGDLTCPSDQLRVGWCSACACFTHPDLEFCPGCGSGVLDQFGVCGEGTVVACTSSPGKGEDKRTTVVVELKVDPAVRLVATLVDCTPEQAQVGLSVRVDFQQAGEMLIPQLRPWAGQVRVRGAAESRRADIPRARRRKFENKVGLTGVGRSSFGRQPPIPSWALAVKASRAAIADAGLMPSDIDGVCGIPGTVGLPGVSSGGIRELERSLEMHPSWHCAGQENAGLAGAAIDSMLAVASGLCRHVLCFTVVPSGAKPRPTVEDESVSQANQVALAASEYLARYCVGREALGWVAIAARQHAARNPNALCRDPIDMSDYLSADPISSPLSLLDCGLVCDGSVALVISAAEKAIDGSRQPVWVEAVGARDVPLQRWEFGLDSHRRAVEQAARDLWSRTSISWQDVDLVAINDAFTLDVLCWLEALRFCDLGEAADFVAGTGRIGPNGELPINPHGGRLAAGGANGFDLYEAVVQLRGEADKRQIPDARVAVACSRDSESASAILLRAER